MSDNQKRPTALVTGASLGIGRAFAEVLAAENCDLVLTARSREKLESLAASLREKHGIKVWVIPEDLSDVSNVDKLVAEIHRQQIQIDYLINNAGFGGIGFVIETDWEAERRMIELNITTLTYLSKIFAKEMVGRGRGRICNVASTAAFQPGPRMAVYYASKAYVLSFTEALANELLGTGVTATALCPGPTESNFKQAANITDERIFASMNLPTSEAVARYGYRSMMEGKTVAVHGLTNRIGTEVVKFFPRNLVTKVVRKLQEKQKPTPPA